MSFLLNYEKSEIILVRIIEKENGKKLPEPFFEWAYVYNQNKKFKNKLEDINQGIRFKNWVKS